MEIGAWLKKQITMSRITCVLATTLGSIIYAIGLDGFLIPHNLLSGGLAGVSVMVYYLTGFEVGTVNFLLNIPILFAAYRWLGGWSVFAAIYGTAAISVFMNVFTFMASMGLSETPLVGSIMGGILVGLGSGITYRTGGTTGGVDPIALIIRKFWGLQIGGVIFAMNFVIIAVSAFIFSIESAVITLISIYITAVVTNKVMVGMQQRKAAFIISPKSIEISKAIINDVGRGATLLHGEGAYTNDSKKIVFAVINLMQVTKLKQVVESIDPKAFVLIADASEVLGQGFTFKNTPEVLNALVSTPTEQEKQGLLSRVKKRRRKLW